uniref:hypothetical protein n=1 Tax=Streptomyces halstedii TaxID=1944 RepID=UPI001E61CC5D|nr:hypothetical protein [Streptomyces halstedii]
MDGVHRADGVDPGAVGDRALEIEPLRDRSGQGTVDPEWSVTATLTRLAEDIGLKFSTVKSARWVSSRWPADRR